MQNKLSALSINLVSILLLILCFNAQAQHYKTSITNPVEINSNFEVKYGTHIIGYQVTDNKMQFGFTYKLYKTKFGIKIFNINSNLQQSQVGLSNGERAYGPFQPQLKIINDKLYLIYFQLTVESEDADIKIFAAEIDTISTGIKTPKEILKIDQKNTGLFKTLGMAANMNFEIASSQDKSKVLVFWWPAEKTNKYFYSVLDSQLNTLRSNNGLIDRKSMEILLLSCSIMNNGDVLASFQNHVNFVDYKGLILLGKSNQPDKLMEIEGLSCSRTVLITSEKTASAFIYGTYYNTEKNVVEGVFSCTLSIPNNKILNVQQTAFPGDLLQQLDMKNWANTKEKNSGIKYDYIVTAYPLEDGSVDLVGEMYKDNIHPSSSSSVYGDIVGAHFSGNNVSFYRIPKYRKSVAYGIGAVHKAVASGNQLLVFYNDDEKNLSKEITEKIDDSNVYTDVVLVAATISNGKLIKREKVIDLKQDNFLALPLTLQKTAPQNLFISIQKIKSLGIPDNVTRWGTINVTN